MRPQVQLAQPLADGAFGHLGRKPPGHLRAQIKAAPAYDAMDLGIGTGDDQSEPFDHLRVAQLRVRAGWPTRGQAVDAFRVVAVHPVAQGLRFIPAWRAVSNRDAPSRIRAIAGIRRVCAASADFPARARRPAGVWSVRVTGTAAVVEFLRAANRRDQERESHFEGFGNRATSQRHGLLVLTTLWSFWRIVVQKWFRVATGEGLNRLQ